MNRTAGETGRCHIDDAIVISSANLHFGEEACLVGAGGSGTVFLTACNLSCIYCQNYDISHVQSLADARVRGRRLEREAAARIMLDLAARGAENINLVSPTHQGPQIFAAVVDARRRGLGIPIVYNCGGYENPDFLRELAGLVDIYMPDFKYGDAGVGERLSGIKDYSRWCMASLREMHRQVGDLALDRRGVARSGLLVRHLVLPAGLAGSRAVIDFIAAEISSATVLNIMAQYRPAGRASEVPELRRRPLRHEIDEVVAYARSRGLTRIIS